MAWIAGVDGCKGGWIAVYAFHEGGVLKDLECHVEKDFENVMSCPAPLAVVAVDMPIGLCDSKVGRACDKEGRKALKGRRSSIFPVPAAGVSDLYREMTYESASRLNEDLTDKRLTKQSWNLVPKIAEVRGYLMGNPASREIVHEVHPEVSFAAMNHHEHGGNDPPFSPMRFYKTTAGGGIERRTLLREMFAEPFEELEVRMPELVGKRAGLDDFYDALACLWTAQRVHRFNEGILGEKCRSLPEGGGPCDVTGLPMQIVY